VEEQNLAAGLETADSAGVDICSLSIGYFLFQNSMFNYTYADMNGNTTISARAADLAAKKGMLVVAAIGNEGGTNWHYMITPSDGDSVLSVGAVDTLGNSFALSSYGPSSDGQIKPNLAAVGLQAMVASQNTGLPVPGNGTSFACPNLAGIATCLWQAFPEVNNMSIMSAMQSNATRTNNPDDRVGYGIPDAKKSFVYLLRQLYTQQSTMNECVAQLNFRVKASNVMEFVIERKLPAETDYVPIKTQSGTGTFAMENFIFNDDLSLIAPGVVHYRTKMTIDTDTTFYLDSLSVTRLTDCRPTEDSIKIAPNPVHDHLNLIISRLTEANFSVVIYNASGQRMYTSAWQQPRGTSTKSISTAHWSAGTYYINVFIDNKKSMTQKFLKR
jgi:hypothetical protein